MRMVTRAEWYQRVNDAWPKPTPALTFPEAERAARRLLRFLKLPRFKIEETSGNRYTWVRHSVLSINVERGWHHFIHGLSHYSHWWHHRSDADYRPHGGQHARLELRCIKEVVKRGWLDGRLKTEEKPEAPPADPAVIRTEKIEHAERMLARAMTRAKRAETIRKKWARRLARLTRGA